MFNQSGNDQLTKTNATTGEQISTVCIKEGDHWDNYTNSNI